MDWFQPLTAVAGFRDPRLHLIRGGYSSLAVNRHIVGVYLVALEVEKQVVYKLLFIPAVKEEREPRVGV